MVNLILKQDDYNNMVNAITDVKKTVVMLKKALHVIKTDLPECLCLSCGNIRDIKEYIKKHDN